MNQLSMDKRLGEELPLIETLIEGIEQPSLQISRL
jgi:hypothetical protein